MMLCGGGSEWQATLFESKLTRDASPERRHLKHLPPAP
jgi:hypothetical protein